MTDESGEVPLSLDERLIDADGHVLEPADLWERYLESRYRDRAIRIIRGADDYEILEVAGTRSKLTNAFRLHTFGGMEDLKAKGASIAEENARRRPTMMAREGEATPTFHTFDLTPDDTYESGNAFGGRDATERLTLLDREGLDKAILYPTLGLLWECETPDAELAAAYCRAYNRWIAEFCADSDGRLVPIAHISFADPDAAAKELHRAAGEGCKGAFAAPFTITRKPHGHQDHDPIFSAAQDLGLPLGLHPMLEQPASSVHQRFDGLEWADWYFDLFAGGGVPQAFATLFQYGVFDRFPDLKVVLLEASAGWIGGWLDRADAIYEGTALGATVQLAEKPSYYFRRQCYVSADPHETTIAAQTKLLGDDKFFWASDYPHMDHPADYLDALPRLTAGMSGDARRGILGETANRVYNLSERRAPNAWSAASA
jgi:predicted TIM-barrel fold metal-dependent hydrolase